MDNNWASEHLQTIRTLMERSALYRRALAPIFTFVGILGIGAAIGGTLLRLTAGSVFGIYWMVVALIAVTGTLVMVRRQALREGEAFWSPPTRRIVQAMLPALLTGLVFSCWIIKYSWQQEGPIHRGDLDGTSDAMILIWTLLYGLALHSAGFFMPRGIRLFGWAFLLAGCGLAFNLMQLSRISPMALMGLVFGASHLACGIYLYFTERKNAA